MTFQTQRFHIIHSTPAWLSMHERVMIYALVAGLQPQRILEIGTFKGGSTLIMCAALDDLDSSARIVCVDPNPRVAPEDWETVSHRTTMVAEGSPEALTTARELSGAPFDFAFIDGDHTHEGVERDIEATLPALADEAHLLFHDAHYFEVRIAIDEAIERHGGTLIDAGLVSVELSPDEPDADGNEIAWGGLRLLRYRRVPA